MARCPECNRFVSLELADEADMDVTFHLATKTLRLTVNLILACAECCLELREGSLAITKVINCKIPDWVNQNNLEEPELQLSLIEAGATKAKDRFGVDGEVWLEAVWLEPGKELDSNNNWHECIAVTIEDGSLVAADFEDI